MQNTGQFLKSAIKSIHNMINIFLKLKDLLVFANKNLRVIIEIYVLIPSHDFFFKQTKKSTGTYLKIICIRLRH